MSSRDLVKGLMRPPAKKSTAPTFDDRFGKLVLLEREVEQVSPTRRIVFWQCICDCGNKTRVRADHLRSGATKSCGCAKPKGAFPSSMKLSGKKD